MRRREEGVIPPWVWEEQAFSRSCFTRHMLLGAGICFKYNKGLPGVQSSREAHVCSTTVACLCTTWCMFLCSFIQMPYSSAKYLMCDFCSILICM